MKRREFFGAVGVVGSAAVVTSIPLSLQAAECSEELPVATEIGTNHGHALDLGIKQVLQMLRETNDGDPVLLDIQGDSGHGHEVQLSHQDLLKLLVEGEVEKVSEGGSHDHKVVITLPLL